MDKQQLKQIIDQGVSDALKEIVPGIVKAVSSQIMADRAETLDFFKSMENKLSAQSRYVALNLIAHNAPKGYVFEYVKDRALKEAAPSNKELI